MSETLKPCPFCGGEAFTHMLGNEIAKGYYIACDECGAKTIVFGYEAEAIEAWNRRAEPERKKGKWIEQDDGWDGVYYECSCCKEAFTLLDGTPSDNLYNFCPNCGAKMDWSE